MPLVKSERLLTFIYQRSVPSCNVSILTVFGFRELSPSHFEKRVDEALGTICLQCNSVMK